MKNCKHGKPLDLQCSDCDSMLLTAAIAKEHELKSEIRRLRSTLRKIVAQEAPHGTMTITEASDVARVALAQRGTDA